MGYYKKNRMATLWLVLASFIFYGYLDVKYVPLLFGSITFNYLVGRQLESHSGHKLWLVFGIVVNVLLLGYFKYMDFFLVTVNNVVGADVFDLPHIVLPLGISFFTFTQSAYLVDAYRKEAAPHDFLTYCEFVTIFPHLIAGPIINHKQMLPQFTATETFHINIKNVVLGLSLFVMGLAKKVLIADRLSHIANNVFSRADSLTCLEAWIGAFSYTFQLYFDFSGYSEMAIGLGLMFNLRLPTNFNSPYQAKSIIDFWRRWHMTLGMWVKDYFYIPMGGNRHGELKKMRNLFLSMLIIGLWHGAGWTFIVWGGLHGIFLMINHQWRRLKINLPSFMNWSITFLCVLVCWVFFRAESLEDALSVLYAMVNIYNIGLPADGFLQTYLSFGNTYGLQFSPWVLTGSFSWTVLGIFSLSVILIKSPNPQVFLESILKYPKRMEIFAFVLGLLLFITILTISHVESDFLYFQF